MAYASQMVLMRRKAAEDGIDVNVIRIDYRDALLRLQRGESSSTTSFSAQQYVAEHQTWCLNWPEVAFPGIDPRDPDTLAAPLSLPTVQAPEPTQQEPYRLSRFKRPRTDQSSASQSFEEPSYPSMSLGHRNPYKRAKEHQGRSRTKKYVARQPSNPIRCHNCGGDHIVRMCTQNIAFHDDPMQLDHQFNPNLAETGQSMSQSEELALSTTNVSTKKIHMTSADVHGVQALLDILKRCEAQRPSNEDAMQKINPGTITQEGAAPNYNIQNPFPTPMGPYGHGTQHASSHEGTIKSMSLPKRTSELSNVFYCPHRPKGLGDAYEVLKPSTFLIPNSASMAVEAYSQRQREEFDKPPSPIRKPSPPSNFSIQSDTLTAPAPNLLSITTPVFNTQLQSGPFTVPPPSLIRQSPPPSSVQIHTVPLPIPSPNPVIPTPPPTSTPKPSVSFTIPPQGSVRKRSRSSSARRPSGHMNIPQLLYSSKSPKVSTLPGCTNCKRPGHEVKNCTEQCGLCDRARHTGGECTFRLHC
ncbi:hypothetical protein VTL71DRAFT_8332 [Oculimacula yallundae]|uniref:CCHC-type domain-containing protein n=1 Tax=Oculimacula yallundae TaxID=86028 RepID=A0ABR4CZP9_9HELO